MEDAPLVDDYDREFDPDSVEKIDRIPIESGSNPDRKPIESRSEADASLPKPLPKPKENAPQENCSKIEHDETDAVVVPVDLYRDEITAHAEFFSFWNDSPWTAPHTNAMPYELRNLFWDRWLDPKWKADLPVAIARLSKFPPFHGRKISLDDFLKNSLYPTKIINGVFDESANRNAATGTSGRRGGKPIPSHLTIGGRPVDPSADVPF